LILVAIAVLPHLAVAQIPDEFTNLKVLPKDIGRGELMDIMRGYAGALGVRCIHCHLGEDPSDLSTVDFVSDEREAKRVARSMMKMVDQINGTLLPATGREDLKQVNCQTCHHGITTPQSLKSLLAATIEAEGIEAGIAQYHELREEHYGSDSYDFSPATLNSLAEHFARIQQDAAMGIELVKINLEFYPDSHYSLFMMGGLQAATEDYDAAIASITRALELDPGNGWYEKTLGRLKAAREEQPQE